MRKLPFFLIILLSACKEPAPRYNGYIDADLTYLSSNYAGRLDNLNISRGQAIQKNQRLFTIEQTSERYGVTMSQLTHDNLIAQKQIILDQLRYQNTNYERTLRMVAKHAASQNDLDVAKKELDVLKNQLNAIDLQIESSQINTSDKQWQLERTEGQALDSGIVFDTYFTPGEYVQAGQPILSLITLRNIKVVFYVPEKVLSQLLLNKKINISSDGNPNLASGTIRYISNIAQYTPPIIYSREEREALVFRVEASIDTPDLNQIHLGQPVSMAVTS